MSPNPLRMTSAMFDEWVVTQRGLILRHRGLDHPFFDLLEEYCADRDFLRVAFRQIYHLVLSFPFHIAGAISTCRDEALLRALVHNLYTEVGEADGEAHITIYRRLLTAVGMGSAPPTFDELWPETVSLEAACGHYYRSPDLGLKLGSLYAFECMSSPMVSRWAQALRRATDLTEQDIEFFVIHIDIEVEHVDDIAGCTSRYADDPRFRSAFQAGAMQIMMGLEAFWDRMNALGGAGKS